MHAQAARFKGLLRMQSNSRRTHPQSSVCSCFLQRGGEVSVWKHGRFLVFVLLRNTRLSHPPLAVCLSRWHSIIFLWGNILSFPGLKDCYWSDHFLFSCHREMAHSLFLKCFIGQSCGNKMLIFFPAGWQRCIHLWTCLGVMSPWRSVFLRGAPASVVLVGAPKQCVWIQVLRSPDGRGRAGWPGPNIAIRFLSPTRIQIRFFPTSMTEITKTLTPCLLLEDFQALTDFLKHGRAQK